MKSLPTELVAGASRSRNLQRSRNDCPLPETGLGPPVAFPRGSRLFREGGSRVSLFRVEAGVIKEACTGADGRDVVVALRYPGRVLGVIAAVLGTAQMTTAIAMTDCEVRSVAATEFDRLRVASPPVGMWLHRILAEECAAQRSRSVRSARADCEMRLRHLFEELVTACGEGRPDGSVLIRAELTVTDIADLVLASRQWVSSVLSAWAERRIVRRQDGWWTVPPNSHLLSK